MDDRAVSSMWSVAIAFDLSIACGVATLLGHPKEVSVGRSKRANEAGGMNHMLNRCSWQATIMRWLSLRECSLGRDDRRATRPGIDAASAS